MIDLHMHTFLSDGGLTPSELIRQFVVRGWEIVGIADHCDTTNCDIAAGRIARAADELSAGFGVRVIPGAEVTHVPPKQIASIVERCRKEGSRVVIVHGETTSEPVAPGTNRAGIEAGADIIAHPGLISEEDAALAASAGVALEISARKGHSLANGHVAAVGRAAGATLIFGSDAHGIADLAGPDRIPRVLASAGLVPDEIEAAIEAAVTIADGKGGA